MDSIYEGWFIGGVIAILIWFYFKWLPAADLKNKFKKLGDLKGLTKAEITRKVGKPKVIKHYNDGIYQCGWAAGKYGVTLQFDKNDICTHLIAEVMA